MIKPEVENMFIWQTLVDLWGVPFMTFLAPTYHKREKREKRQTGNGNGQKVFFPEVQEKSAENKNCWASSIYGGSFLWPFSLRPTISEKNAKNRKPETEMVETGNGNGSIILAKLFLIFPESLSHVAQTIWLGVKIPRILAKLALHPPVKID